MEYLIGIMFIGFFMITPIVLTILNLIALFRGWDTLTEEKQGKQKLRCVTTMILGFVFSVIWAYTFGEVTDYEYYEAIVTGGMPGDGMYHKIISGEFGAWFWVMAMLSGLCLCLLQCLMGKRKPPLVSVILISGTCTANLLSAVFVLQTAVNVFLLWPVWVFCLNILLLSVRAVFDEIDFQLNLLRTEDNLPAKGLNAFIYQILNTRSRWMLAGIAMLLPIAGILIIILILTGQGADSIIKAFTMTADWTFSQQIPPPPEEYDGHYLCTVAAGGHQKIVKPIRMGIRRGQPIVVNRQLCIANAFEDLLIDKMPRFHQKIRKFYDAYGYPVSKHITTPIRADIVYLLMKPLEWCFLLILYLFDTRPEGRIAMQYTGKKYHSPDSF